MALTELAGAVAFRRRGSALVAESWLADHQVVFAIPQRFMNVSGGPVKEVAGFFKIPPQRTIVLFDDLELEFGTIRLPVLGDHGHNGLRSITKVFGADYVRAGLGIGRPPGRMPVADFVLKPFTKAERPQLPIMWADMADEVTRFITTSGT